MTATTIQYRVVSQVYQGGGVQSTHRTLSGAQRALRRQDAAIRHLNRHGGTSYHDCRIETLVDGRWHQVDERGQVLADLEDYYGN